MKNKKMMIGLLVALSVILIGIIIVCGILFMDSKDSKNNLNGTIQKAEKYLASQDYTNAIIEYQRVLELDEKNEAAYIGLANTYWMMSDKENAYNTLVRGLSLTGSDTIQNLLKTYFPDWNQDEEKNEKEESDEISLNSTTISMMAGYTYSDYTNKYGKASVSRDGAKYVLSYGSLPIDFIYYNSGNDIVIDSGTNLPKNGVKPVEMHITDLNAVFSGMESMITLEEIKSKGVSSLKCEYSRTLESYAVTFIYSGCKFAIQSTESGTIESRTAKNIVVPVNREAVADKFDLEGIVKSSKNAKGVKGVSLIFRKGNSKSGSSVATCTTDSSGGYFVQLEAGDYTIQAKKDGWTEDFFKVHVNDYESSTKFDMVISPLQAEGEISIVLTWGSAPSDVDAHLEGTTDNHQSIHVWYGNMTGNKDIAELDVDDQNGYGPETLTLHNLGGTYKYYIVDYTNTGSLGISDAKIKVYKNGRVYKEYKVPTNARNKWEVFEIKDGVISDIGRVS